MARSDAWKARNKLALLEAVGIQQDPHFSDEQKMNAILALTPDQQAELFELVDEAHERAKGRNESGHDV